MLQSCQGHLLRDPMTFNEMSRGVRRMSFCDGIKGKSTPTIERVKEHDIFAVSIDVAFCIDPCGDE